MGLNRQLANLPDAITTDTSNNVGIGGSPSGTYKFEVTGNGRFNNSSAMALQVNGGTFTQATSSSYSLGVGNTGGYDLTLGTSTTAGVIQTWSSKPLSLNPQGNNVLIGSTTDSSYKLDVTGTVRFSSTLLVSGAATFSSAINATGDINSLYGMAAARNGSNTQGSGPYFLLSNAAFSQLWYQQLNASNGIDYWYNGSVKLTIASTGAATFSDNVLLSATKRLYLSGTSYIQEVTAGTIRLAPAGNDSFDITSSLLNVWVPAVFDSTIKTTAISTNNGTRIADSNVAYTLFTISTYGLYIVYVDLPAGSGTPSDYSSYAIISNDGTTARILQQTNGALMFITLSGNNVQGRQTSGGQYNIRYVYQRIAV